MSTAINRHKGNFTWERTEVLKYKEDGSPFKDVTRQILFEGRPDLPCQLRYFEVSPGGHSTLERHEHVHAVMVARGSGKVLVGEEIVEAGPQDVIHVPPDTWHQFRAVNGEPFGFLCLVNCERDRPQLPNDTHLAELRRNPRIKDFIRV